ncbi:hypothetical protein [Leptospira sp. severe_002]|uniref:hypothetical protein n=1 Tax=Leptospira sp. severe_002 TaxID=2838237 RepID=UPI001E3988C4|nr:hypothetical protein [Leptospira sp. severe_002]
MLPQLRQPFLMAAFLAAATAPVAAQTTADVIEQWGLIGKWSADCQRAPTRGAPLLTYTKARDGSVTRTATAGGKPNTSNVVAARTLPDGSIEITEKDPDDTMTFVLSKDGSGKHRSMSSHDDKGHYYIRDGKFTGNGNETPLLSRCP